MPEELTVESLVPWLTTPPVVYAVAAVGILFVAFIAWLLLFRSHGLPRSLRREIEILEAEGAWRAAGVRWEEVDQHTRALEAYRRGKAHTEAARLLHKLGRLKEAKKAAQTGGAWSLYAEIAEAGDDQRDAAQAWKRAGQPFAAGRCYEKAGDVFEAVECWIAAGEPERAIAGLAKEKDARVPVLLDKLLRTDLVPRGPRRAKAVEHAVRLFVQHGEPERGFQLALHEDRLDLALPIAAEHLPPSQDIALAYERAGDPAAAAEVYEALGDAAQAALLRGDAHVQADDPAAAAEAYEIAGAWPQAAELWLVAGDIRRAAEAWEKTGSWERAATLWGQEGDSARQQAALAKVQDEETFWGNASVAPGIPRQSGLTVPGAPAETQTSLLRNAGAPGAPGAPQPGAPQPQQAPGLPPQTSVLPGGAAPHGRHTAVVPGGAVEDPTVVTGGDVTAALSDVQAARYEVRGELGRGGMGVVYRAWDNMLHRPVAYKVLHDGEAGDIDALLSEARAAARLSHPNIVTVYDAGRHNRGAFIVMELIEGRTFSSLLGEKKLSIKGAVTVARQICSALAHAHGKRIVHRDLKPSNLLWLAEERRVKLTDFGLARALEASGAVMTHAAGTPSYMAPEQIKAEPVDPRTDLYSLGCVLYEMLTGAPPFPRSSSLYHHLTTEPTDPSEIRDDIPAPLAALVLQCMQKEPGARPRSAKAVDSVLATL